MVLYCILKLGGYVVDLEQVGEQMRLFIMACQVAALKQCVSSIWSLIGRALYLSPKDFLEF